MKTYCLGDVHGTYKALMQCFERAGFNYNEDRLIVLGDVVDGYPETKECINELKKIKDLVYVIGNHDQWVLSWMNSGITQPIWITQGGDNTIKSYGGQSGVPESHRKFLRTAYLYYEQDNKLFVHAGVDPNQKDIKKQRPDLLVWDRQLIQSAWQKEHQKRDWKVMDYDKIFIGHTTTQWFKKDGKEILEPIFACNIINLDTGAGWSGKLTIMDIDTYEYWQSDTVIKLYGSEQGRKG